MQLIFKTTDVPAGKEPLVSHTDLKKYSPSTHRNLAWETMSPFVEEGTRRYVIGHVGRDWYEAIAAKYQAGTALSDEETEAVSLLQRAVTHYAIYEFTAGMLTAETDMGTISRRDREGTAQAASGFAYHETRRNAMLSGDAALDDLLAFLTDQVRAENTDFDLFAASPNYLTLGSDFFRTTDEMDEFLNIRGSRRAFKSIARYFKKAEMRYLRPILGVHFYEELASEYFVGTANPVHKEVLRLSRAYLAEVGLIEAIPHISCVLKADAIVIISSTDSFNSAGNSNTLFGQAMIERVQAKAELDAKRAKRELEEELIVNRAAYPTYLANHYDEGAAAGATIVGDANSGALIL